MLELKRILDPSISLTSFEKKKFREEFNLAMYLCGEMIFGKMSTDKIIERFRTQGYWAGVSFRIKPNVEDGTLYTEPRRFCNQ